MENWHVGSTTKATSYDVTSVIGIQFAYFAKKRLWLLSAGYAQPQSRHGKHWAVIYFLLNATLLTKVVRHSSFGSFYICAISIIHQTTGKPLDISVSRTCSYFSTWFLAQPISCVSLWLLAWSQLGYRKRYTLLCWSHGQFKHNEGQALSRNQDGQRKEMYANYWSQVHSKVEESACGRLWQQMFSS